MRNLPFHSLDLARLKTNLYSVIQRPPTASIPEVRRLLRSLRLTPPEVLKHRLPFSSDEFLELFVNLDRRTDDPIQLWVDEFFFPWSSDPPELHSGTTQDRAYYAKQALAGDPTDPIRLHDHAVACFLAVAELEGAARPRDPQWNSRCGRAWQDALRSWREFIGNEGFWKRCAERISQKRDPRLHVLLQAESRYAMALVPIVLLARLKLDLFVRRGTLRLEFIDDLLEIARKDSLSNGFDVQAAWRYCLSEFEARQEILLRILESKREIALTLDSPDPSQIMDVVPLVERHLALMKAYALNHETVGQELFDRLGHALQDLIVAYGNTTEDWTPFESLLPLVEEHAFGVSLKRRVGKDKETVKRICLEQAHAGVRDRIQKLAEALESGRDTAEDLPTLETLQWCLFEGLDEKIYLESPRITDFSSYETYCDDLATVILKKLLKHLKFGNIDIKMLNIALKCRDMAVSEDVKDESQKILNKIKNKLNSGNN